MSSSSETSLAELPQPYDISSAVSKALCLPSGGGAAAKPEVSICSSNSAPKRMRSASYPVPAGYLTSYDMQVPSLGAHGLSNSYGVGDGSDNCAAAASSYYCPASNTYPYYTPHPEPAQYLYPVQHQQQHYPPTAVMHQLPDLPQAHMDMEPWNETAAMSICNSSSSIFDSQENIEQLDKFCKYIDSSGDEEFMVERESSSGEGCNGEACNGEGCSNADGRGILNPAKNRYDQCFITGNLCSEMLDSPPKKKRRNACAMSMSDYFSDDLDNTMDSTLVEGVFDSTEERSWKVELDNATMWREFDMVGTEMVITKAGRY